MKFTQVSILFALASAASAQMAPIKLFTLTGESTADIRLCQQEGIEDCRKIQVRALA